MATDTAQPGDDAQPTERDRDETDRFSIATIINYLRIKPDEGMSEGAREALSFAQSSACEAARRIFTRMAR
jgi:hypothetical protein